MKRGLLLDEHAVRVGQPELLGREGGEPAAGRDVRGHPAGLHDRRRRQRRDRRRRRGGRRLRHRFGRPPHRGRGRSVERRRGERGSGSHLLHGGPIGDGGRDRRQLHGSGVDRQLERRRLERLGEGGHGVAAREDLDGGGLSTERVDPNPQASLGVRPRASVPATTAADAQERARDLDQPRGRVGAREPGREGRRVAVGDVDLSQDELALAQRVVAPPEHEHDRGVRGVLVAHRGLVHGLVREIHRADHGRVQLAAAQSVDRDLQRADPAELLRRRREARARERELRAESIRGDVRERADHVRRLERRPEGVGRGADPGLVGAERVSPRAGAPARAPARYLRVAAVADEHAGRLARERDPGHRLERGGEQHRLLRAGLLEVGRREAQLAHRDADALRGAERAPVVEHTLEVGDRLPVAHPRAEADHHDGAPRRRGHGGEGPVALVRLDEQVRVVAAEAERAQPRATRATPRGWPVERLERRRGERGARHVEVRGRKEDAFTQRLEELQEPGDARGGDQVADVRLERADRHRTLAVDRAHRGELRRVADPGPGRVALDVRDVARLEPRLLEGEPHRARLPLLGGRQQVLAAAVVRETDASDHPVDRAARAHRVVQALEHHDAAALAGHQSVGPLVEGPAPAGPAHRAERAEAHVDEEIIGAVHRPREHAVGATRLQITARALDGVERRRARGVERVRATTEAERLREQVGGEPAVEAVARVGGREPDP